MNNIINSANCLNTIRIIAALEVALGHIAHHLNVYMPPVIDKVLHYFHGVPIFFVLSGFLIWQSIDRCKDFSTYFKKRVLRIYPELWFCLLFEILAIIFFYHNWNIKDLALFSFTQATLFQFWTPDSLRGFGCGTPNGSLWTITVIVQFYFLIWLTKDFLKGKSFIRFGGVLGISVILSMLQHLSFMQHHILISKLYAQTVFNYLFLFLLGVLLAEFKDSVMRIAVKYWHIFTMIGILLYCVNIDIPYTSYKVLFSLFSIYGLIGFAYAYPKFNVEIDISYGFYIYHMLIVNILIALGKRGEVFFAIVALISSLVIAYITTKTVGVFAKSLR